MNLLLLLMSLKWHKFESVQQMRHVNSYRRYSLCHEKCFQPCTENRQRHVQSKCSW